MKKYPKEKKKKTKQKKLFITAHDAAMDLIRPFILRQISATLASKFPSYDIAERYSAFLKTKKTIKIDMIDDKEVNKEFTVKRIIRDIIDEHIKEVKKIYLLSE